MTNSKKYKNIQQIGIEHRYIDAETYKAVLECLSIDEAKLINTTYGDERIRHDASCEALELAMARLDAIPTEDVQPVVHCVKCKYRDKMEFCILNDIFINEKDFCSKGDKLDGDEHD